MIPAPHLSLCPDRVSPCNSGWTAIHRDGLTRASLMLGFEVCATKPSFMVLNATHTFLSLCLVCTCAWVFVLYLYVYEHAYGGQGVQLQSFSVTLHLII